MNSGTDDAIAEIVVTSPKTLTLLAGADGGAEWFRDPSNLPPEPLGYVRRGQFVYLVSDSDVATSRCVAMHLNADGSLLGLEASSREYVSVLERVAQFCERARNVPVQLPSSWGPYRSDDRYAFAAAPIAQNPRGLRCVAQVEKSTRSVTLWTFYRREEAVDIADVQIDEQSVRNALGFWSEAVDRGREAIVRAAASPDPDRRRLIIESPSQASRSVPRTYEEWQERLTPAQLQFVENDNTPNLELSGPAGSGKTLTLELKALREVHRAHADGRVARVLFATHSWASADQVDRDLRQLDILGAAFSVEVLPLSALAEDLTPEGAWRPDGMALLGDDSLSSKQLQIEIIDGLVDAFVQQDWFTYQAATSLQFRSRIESDQLDVRRALNEDLLTEFGCVLAAENIFRGRGAKEKYLSLRRGAWMMPLDTERDREVVFELYQTYLNELRTNSLVTTDILMSEFFRYLEGPVWDIERETRGFDLVLVDEVHLFNVQEKMALRSLMSDPMKYPRVCVAMDLRQSPQVRGEVPRDTSIESQSIELNVVHRYSPEILSVVRHLPDDYPTLDLAESWYLDLDVVESRAEHGPKPVLHLVSGYAEGVLTAAAARANELRDSPGQTALLVLDDRLFGQYVDLLGGRPGVSVVAGRDDLLSLQHAKKSLVLGLAEHVAGLQFTNVLVAALPEGLSSTGCPAYHLRGALTLLYLACSRAEQRLEVFHDREVSTPDVLQRALRSGVIVQARS